MWNLPLSLEEQKDALLLLNRMTVLYASLWQHVCCFEFLTDIESDRATYSLL